VVDRKQYLEISNLLARQQVSLVAVSKTKPAEEILELYELGHRDFGENYVQELVQKQEQLPKDIRWHFIGHLQSNKVRQIAPFVHLVHGVDSGKLLQEIGRQAKKHGRVIDCLLQVHIAIEETKFGLDEAELTAIISGNFDHVNIRGLMGMASFTDDREAIASEFRFLKSLYDKYAASNNWNILSMGMSSDYAIAIEEGSTMVRIGSLLFGKRH
jgi:pyridoxal phosphate enzyme (YggS family)